MFNKKKKRLIVCHLMPENTIIGLYYILFILRGERHWKPSPEAGWIHTIYQWIYEDYSRGTRNHRGWGWSSYQRKSCYAKMWKLREAQQNKKQCQIIFKNTWKRTDHPWISINNIRFVFTLHETHLVTHTHTPTHTPTHPHPHKAAYTNVLCRNNELLWEEKALVYYANQKSYWSIAFC